ncbi:hypothetical protein BKA93DRAFT_773271 [Sparassis latifolia]
MRPARTCSTSRCRRHANFSTRARQWCSTHAACGPRRLQSHCAHSRASRRVCRTRDRCRALARKMTSATSSLGPRICKVKPDLGHQHVGFARSRMGSTHAW